MGKTISKAVIEPTCDCCDKLVLYVLNGCKSECGIGRCCTCKIEAVNHNADEFVIDENTWQKKSLFLFNCCRHLPQRSFLPFLHQALYNNNL